MTTIKKKQYTDGHSTGEGIDATDFSILKDGDTIAYKNKIGTVLGTSNHVFMDSDGHAAAVVVGEPQGATHAASKNYVDTYVPYSSTNNAYGFFYTTSATTVTDYGIFYNVPLTNVAENTNTSISGNRAKVSKAGVYHLHGRLQILCLAGGTAGWIRLGKNSDNDGEILGTYACNHTAGAEATAEVICDVIVTLAANDEISLQLMGSNANGTTLGYWSGSSTYPRGGTATKILGCLTIYRVA